MAGRGQRRNSSGDVYDCSKNVHEWVYVETPHPNPACVGLSYSGARWCRNCTVRETCSLPGRTWQCECHDNAGFGNNHGY